jgi:hypothetical protein
VFLKNSQRYRGFSLLNTDQIGKSAKKNKQEGQNQNGYTDIMRYCLSQTYLCAGTKLEITGIAVAAKKEIVSHPPHYIERDQFAFSEWMSGFLNRVPLKISCKSRNRFSDSTIERSH